MSKNQTNALARAADQAAALTAQAKAARKAVSQTERAIKAAEARAEQILPFHKDAFTICQTGHRATLTMQQKLDALIVSRYGQCLPSAVDYAKDQRALALLAEAKGLADNQHVRKPYAAAIKARYGCLPVGTGADAEAKRLERYNDAQRAAYDKALKDATVTHVCTMNDDGEPVRATPRADHWIKALAHSIATQADKGKRGAPQGQPQASHEHHVGEGDAATAKEGIEQFITRVGMHEVLAALTRLLDADKSTKTQAKTLAAIDNQLRSMKSPADVSASKAA